MITRSSKIVRTAVFVATGAALTSFLATEVLPSRGKPSPLPSDWVEIGVATDGTRASVNRHSITETGPGISLWQRFTIGSPRSQAGSPEAVEQLVIYDCPGRKVSTLESRELGGGGVVLRAQKFQPPVQDAIRAASLPEYIYDAVC